MAPKKIAWKSMKPPQTAQQKIQYMTACQCWFTQVMTRNYKEPSLQIENYESHPQRIQNTLIGYDTQIFSVNDDFECIVCKKSNNINQNCQYEANPFSFMTVLNCENCSIKNVSNSNIG